MAEVQTWFRSQTGGRHPLFEMDGDRVSVATVELSDQGDDTLRVQAEVYQSLGSRPPLAHVWRGRLPCRRSIDYSWSLRDTAAGIVLMIAGQVYRRILLGIGNSVGSSHTSSCTCWGQSNPAPPTTASLGHVLTFFSEDEHPGELSDIMSSWGGSRELSKSVLDVGRDDYYGHGRDDCYDISPTTRFLAYPDAGAELAAAPGVVGTAPEPRSS